jgi:aminoglycoside 6'-N-acetyltransferase
MADLPLMHKWLNSPGVLEVWSDYDEWTMERIFAKYAGRIAGKSPTTPYAILCDGKPVGYIQSYLWRDYPDYASHLDLQEEAASLDVFIGEAEYRHRGLGPMMLRQFLKDVIFADPAVDSCVITPMADNAPALRAYAKAGFKHLRTIEVPDEPGPVYLMRIGREEALATGQ